MPPLPAVDDLAYTDKDMEGLFMSLGVDAGGSLVPEIFLKVLRVSRTHLFTNAPPNLVDVKEFLRLVSANNGAQLL
jgi:hypothetical protein